MDLETFRETIGPWIGNRWLQALAVLLVAFLAAKLTDVILSRVLRRLTEKTRTDLDDRVLDLLHKPIFYSVALIGLRIALDRLAVSPAAELNLGRLIKTGAVLLWVVVGIRGVGLFLEYFSRSRDPFPVIDKGTYPLFNNLARAIFFGAAVYFVLLSWDIDATAFVAVGSVLTFVIAFAAQDTLSNLFAGIGILADKPYEIGDFINLDSGERGEVSGIGLRSTRLLTRDDIEISIPNSVMAQAKIVNETGGSSSKMRIRVKVGVAYGSDIAQVEEILLGVSREHTEVCSDPEPRVRFRNFGESGLDVELLCWIEEPVYRGRILHELNKAVYKQLNANKIEIPYPKRDVYLHSD